MVLYEDYKYYSNVFSQLKNWEYCKNGDQIYNLLPSGKLGKFVWFTKDNSFCLNGIAYLHAEFYTYLDPYSLYWLIKYRRWCKKNIENVTQFTIHQM